MKYIILITALLTTNYFTAISNAQSFGLGLKLGADISKVEGFSLNNEFKGHFLGGMQAHLRFGRLGLQAEAHLTQTQITTGDNFYAAFKDFVKTTSSTVTGTDIMLTELGLPVLVDLRLLGIFRIEAGIQYSLIINAKDKNDYLMNPDDVMNDAYLSGLLGVKMELGKVQIGGRYLKGWDNLNASPVREEWKTGRYQLYLSYLLWK